MKKKKKESYLNLFIRDDQGGVTLEGNAEELAAKLATIIDKNDATLEIFTNAVMVVLRSRMDELRTDNRIKNPKKTHDKPN